ncbi:Crp/Fnr family transcriptional regulator [Rhodopseudomonas sp. P2A-2r]|uniref:Crp/Fnr family transcriptional regulator n=1 Tax=unclassified Rhodopseudomonas TaxID=2638247 RepID=UPI0022348C59|nr:Crp/Fnr family transcriptional regulator [Rhodopseudomonas sp. P2A-2r]UZE47565.1 Crp/Fnr family transcriptional regulator [Rhodopseudomonas sp. P2A-2r]
MRTWLEDIKPLAGLEPATRKALAAIVPAKVPQGTVLFRPGDVAPGFLVVLSGRVEVYLIGRSGREMLLYDVVAGQTCIQTTLCVLGEHSYTGEAVAQTDTSFVMIPKNIFAGLMNSSQAFRGFVFGAFGDRLKDVVSVLEKVSFVRLESRLAAELLRRAGSDDIALTTHRDLATAIGSVREVVSRRLEDLQKAGLVQLTRGKVTLIDRPALARVGGDAALT